MVEPNTKYNKTKWVVLKSPRIETFEFLLNSDHSSTYRLKSTLILHADLGSTSSGAYQEGGEEEENSEKEL